MTELKAPLKREVATLIKGTPLIVELHPSFVRLRLKRKRHAIDVEYRAILDLAYKLLDRQQRADKAKRRRT